MDTVKNLKNHALKRQEIVFKLDSEKGPSFPEMRKKVSEEFSKPEENIDVYNVKGSFGKKVFEVSANIYDSKEAFENAIQMKKTQKQKGTEKKAAEEAAKAAAETKKSADEAKKKEEETKAAEAPAA